MKIYAIFNKRKLVIFSLVFICIGFICCEICAAGNIDVDAATNSDRIEFIEKCGYTVLSEDATEKTVNIPEKFYDVYENYNTLQKAAGYDLSLYKGCKVKIYSYSITPPQNYSGDCLINLIVYNDRVIGGDVSSTALGGFMLPLKQEKK